MKIFKLTVFLALIAGLSGAILSTVYTVTEPIIEEANFKVEQENLVKIYNNGEEFIENDIGIEDYDSIENIYEVTLNDEIQGYVYKISVYGYGGDIEYLIALDNDGTYKGYEVIDCSSETSGFGSQVGEEEFQSTIVGKSIGDDIDTISGATISSTAVVGGINDAYEHYSTYFK